MTGAPSVRAAAAMTAREYRLLREAIYDHCGLSLGEELRGLVERRLAPRLVHHRLGSFAEYHDLLCHDDARRAELDLAAEALATHETYFFRDAHQLRAFSEELLPALAREHAGEQRLRVWSAGCSTGEEVYTLAILLVRSGLFDGWALEVVGSDIARGALAAARAGVYGAHAFRSQEAQALKPWFRAEGDGWHVADEVRRISSFAHANLLDAGATSRMPRADVIFCRNVLIYFDPPARRRALRALLDRLRPGGWLFVGHAESLLDARAGLEPVPLGADLAYRRAAA